jgi:hypothetical protein
MRKSIVAAAGVAAVLAFTLPAAKAAAMPVAAPDQLGFPSGMANGVEKTVLVCGPWGLLLAARLLGSVPPLSLLGLAPALLVGVAPAWMGLGMAPTRVGLGPAMGLAPLVTEPLRRRRASAR